MIAVGGCLLCLLTDLLDRFDRRFAVDREWGDALPDHKWLAWGLCGKHGERRYFFLKLPSWSYEYHIEWDADRWGQRALLWMSGRGWRVIHVVCYE